MRNSTRQLRRLKKTALEKRKKEEVINLTLIGFSLACLTITATLAFFMATFVSSLLFFVGAFFLILSIGLGGIFLFTLLYHIHIQNPDRFTFLDNYVDFKIMPDELELDESELSLNVEEKSNVQNNSSTYQILGNKLIPQSNVPNNSSEDFELPEYNNLNHSIEYDSSTTLEKYEENILLTLSKF